MGAFVVDGTNIPSEGLPLLATQDTPTGFGNATGGGQDSAGGSELNQLYGEIVGGTLNFAITGNLEGNFNKMWIFLDGVDGGESTLLNDNADGGFGEINNLAGLNFSGGTPDHGFRFEIGSGFYGINAFDLIDNTAGVVTSGGGPGDLPLAGVVGGFGTTVGWDNSNILGVDGASAAGANTATTGWEFSVDMATLFGEVPSSVGITAFISSGDGTFISNQVLPGIGGGGNLGAASGNTVGMTTVVPEPSSALMALAASAGFLLRRRR